MSDKSPQLKVAGVARRREVSSDIQLPAVGRSRDTAALLGDLEDCQRSLTAELVDRRLAMSCHSDCPNVGQLGAAEEGQESSNSCFSWK